MIEGEGATAVTVVEDDPAIRTLLADALARWNFHPQLADSAESALELLHRQPTPILLTDLRMPGRDGVWLVREVRNRWPEIVTFVVTGAHDLDDAIQCLNAGARRYFLKPFDLSELREALERALDGLVQRRERAQQQRRLEAIVRKQTQRARATFLSGIESLFLALEARDPYISGHSQRVRRYALALARALGLTRVELRQISLAAKLHDIGKVAIPEHILHKTTALTEEERLTIQAHPVIGEEIIRPIVRNRAVLAAIRGHHERIDGDGYPDGLVGDAIPFFARLLGVVDCYDALTTNRPYRAQLSIIRAVGVLNEVAATQLDSELVRVFVRLLADRPRLSVDAGRKSLKAPERRSSASGEVN